MNLIVPYLKLSFPVYEIEPSFFLNQFGMPGCLIIRPLVFNEESTYLLIGHLSLDLPFSLRKSLREDKILEELFG